MGPEMYLVDLLAALVLVDYWAGVNDCGYVHLKINKQNKSSTKASFKITNVITCTCQIYIRYENSIYEKLA